MVDKKYPRSKAKDQEFLSGEAAYVSWDSGTSEERDEALASYSKAIGEFTSGGARGRNFSDMTTYQSGRPGLQRSDYDYYRSNEAVPVKSKDILSFARRAYRRIGLIRNAIDLMGDFACQGVRLAHPNPRIERFYNDWFSRVKGDMVSERFCNLLFREANVPVRMKTAKVNNKKRLEMQKSIAEVDMKADLGFTGFSKSELPWHYVFLDPLLLSVVGGEIASLSGVHRYRMDIPQSLKRQILALQRSGENSELLENLPKEFLEIDSSSRGILLPSDKTFVYHYKKDDWQQWADPMTYACFDDLILYEKLKLADKAALDGAVNKIRVWKLGNLDHKLAPTATAASALGNILGANTGGGTMDIVWGPDIELLETGTDVQRFLGEEKYRPTLMSIYSCLGIPPTLTGTFGASGTTNNFISLKTLTERLNYVRGVLSDFWNYQIKLVQKSMGFRFPAQLEFDFMNLEDPAAMSTLLINLADRNIISDEFVQRNVKANPSIEKRRMLNEDKLREKSGGEKISPYHAVDKDFSLEKIALQTGVASPSEVGLDLEEKPEGEESALEMRRSKEGEGPSVKDKEGDSPGTPGRPKNSKDVQQREERQFKPALKASIEIWAKKAQEDIAKIINPILLDGFGKKNMRSLSSKEFADSEKVKFEILCSIGHGDEVNQDSVSAAIKNLAPKSIHRECDQWISKASEDADRRLTIEEIRSLRASYYAYYRAKTI
jgi:hypothetical protein